MCLRLGVCDVYVSVNVCVCVGNSADLCVKLWMRVSFSRCVSIIRKNDKWRAYSIYCLLHWHIPVCMNNWTEKGFRLSEGEWIVSHFRWNACAYRYVCTDCTRYRYILWYTLINVKNAYILQNRMLPPQRCAQFRKLTLRFPFLQFLWHVSRVQASKWPASRPNNPSIDLLISQIDHINNLFPAQKQHIKHDKNSKTASTQLCLPQYHVRYSLLRFGWFGGRAGHLSFEVLWLQSKGYSQAKITLKVTYFCARPL